MVSRRGVLTLVGGGVVLAAAGVGGVTLMGAPSQDARRPWRQAGQYGEFRRRALSYALLAPNPHNLQPWRVRLEGDDALTLFHDASRRLPVTDPADRQITIGCGAFLELLSMAAAQEGIGVEITPFPEGEDMRRLDARPVAHVRFLKAGAAPDPLFAHVLARRSNKQVYEPRDVDAQALLRVEGAGRVFGMSARTVGNTALAAQLRQLTWDAHVREVTTPDAMGESVELMRIGAREVAANPDGIELEGPMIALGQLAGLINRDTLGDPGSSAFRQGLDMYRRLAMSARAFGWLVNENAWRGDQINAGRAYVRMNLQATALGLGMHPWSQALQEYPEMADLHDRVQGLLGEGRRVQMLFRIGYAPPTIPTPRRGLEFHLA